MRYQGTRGYRKTIMFARVYRPDLSGSKKMYLLPHLPKIFAKWVTPCKTPIKLSAFRQQNGRKNNISPPKHPPAGVCPILRTKYHPWEGCAPESCRFCLAGFAVVKRSYRLFTAVSTWFGVSGGGVVAGQLPLRYLGYLDNL